MLYIFFVIACVCSNYLVASEKGQSDKVAMKMYYDKVIADKIKDDKERAKYDEGYIVVANNVIIPYSKIEIMVPIGKDGFMSFPISHPIHQELNKREIEKNSNQLVMSK